MSDDRTELEKLRELLAEWRASGKHLTDGLQPTVEQILESKIARLEREEGL